MPGRIDALVRVSMMKKSRAHGCVRAPSKGTVAPTFNGRLLTFG